MSKNKKKIIKISALFFVAILIFGISETFYHLKNKTPQLMSFYLALSKLESKQNNLDGTMKYLKTATEIKISLNKKRYPKIIPDYKVTTPNLLDINTKKAFLEYFGSTFFKDPLPVEEKLTKIYYDLGLIAYKNGDKDATVLLWKTAVYLNPELSHTQVELANFYLSEENEEKARETLEFCLESKYAQKHCKDYFDTNFTLNTPREPGFLKNEIERYYKSLP